MMRGALYEGFAWMSLEKSSACTLLLAYRNLWRCNIVVVNKSDEVYYLRPSYNQHEAKSERRDSIA